MAVLNLKKIVLTITITALFCNVFSQEFSLNLENITQKSKEQDKKDTGEKPSWAASGLNLLVPGTGYFYLGEKKPAITYLTTEITLWGGFFFTYFTSRNRFNSSIGFARLYAHTQSNRRYDDEYWGYLGNTNFMRTEDYNKAALSNRDIDKTYTDERDQWAWDSEEQRDKYAGLRKKAESWQTASTLILGTLALNRLVSFITARVATKRYNDKLNFTTPPVISTDMDIQNKSYGIYLSFGI